ncbi:MAG: hypothetical protein ABI650_11890 [Dokdonella sp.]
MNLEDNEAVATSNPHAIPDPSSPRQPTAEPEVGDVIDALEDALASLKAIVSNQATSTTNGIRSVIRENPLAALAVTAGIVYVVARWRR